MNTPPDIGRTAWFNCQAGVAGDMVMAALVDAGASTDDIADTLAGLGVDGYALLFERVQRSGIGATWANVVTHHDLASHDDHTHNDGDGDGDGDGHGHGHDDDEDHDHDHDHDHDGDSHGDDHGRQRRDHGGHRPVREILALLDAADLPARVRVRARAVFEQLAAVEGAIHDVDPADVELHEVGALDSIIDVVGVCAALESLGIDTISCSSIGLGNGIVRTAHGELPHPAPATMALLTQASALTHGLDTTLETATPTGAALMTTLASSFGSMPGGTSSAVGYGAGTADPPGRANVVQVVVITAAPSS